jgi:hypothetical protein
VSALESSLYYKLVNDGPILALVGTRIYPNYAPIGVANPCITYTKISGEDVRSAAGDSGLSSANVQIGCWADTYLEAATIRAAVIACLNDYVGTVDGIAFQVIALMNDFDAPVVEPENEEQNEFGKLLDFIIWFK